MQKRKVVQTEEKEKCIGDKLGILIMFACHKTIHQSQENIFEGFLSCNIILT